MAAPSVSLLKRIAARLPLRWQAELKRLYFRRQIANDAFYTAEAEFVMLPQLIQLGDWVIDIGANVGQYTKRMSDLVGPRGRVIAFEPVPATFALLSANAEQFRHANVTLINAAASSSLDVVGMDMPRFAGGLINYYEAHLTDDPSIGVQVLVMPVDSLALTRPVALVKIDAEGHEAHVLQGMLKLVQLHHPTMIIETGSPQVVERLESLGYDVSRATGSSNIVCRPKAAPVHQPHQITEGAR